MIKLVSITSRPSLLTEIIGQFAFMKAMSLPEDSNYDKLKNLSLDEVYKECYDFLSQFVDDMEMIITDECDLPKKLNVFLSKYSHVTDVVSIQQNIHYRLNLLDKDV